MFKSILLPTDGSQLSERAMETAIPFAQLHGASIVAISVVQPFPFVPMSDGGVIPDAEVFEFEMEKVARANVEKVVAAARAAGVACEAVVATSHSPYDAIVQTAEEHRCDLIMMASHGRKGLNKLFLGSETQKVLAHTTLPVLVLR